MTKQRDLPLCPCRCMPARLCPAPQDAGNTCPCHPHKRGRGHKGSDELLHKVRGPATGPRTRPGGSRTPA